MRRMRLQTLLICIVLCCPFSFAQYGPMVVSVASLSQNPREFDGRLVSVRASLVFGWEGDNFLYDSSDLSPGKTPPRNKPRVWLYCRPGYEKPVYDAVPRSFEPVRGTFVGYFHFVPNKKGRADSMFDPGPLQLEGIAVTETGSQPASMH